MFNKFGQCSQLVVQDQAILWHGSRRSHTPCENGMLLSMVIKEVTSQERLVPLDYGIDIGVRNRNGMAEGNKAQNCGSEEI
jgi:hypothetical protein